MDTRKVVELERLEAIISSWSGMKRLVRVPLAGTAQLAFYGTLKMQLDADDEPQFYITRPDAPSPTLVFYVKDIMFVKNADSENPQIWLKPLLDISQPFE